jgi:hypothetical protein
MASRVVLACGAAIALVAVLTASTSLRSAGAAQQRNVKGSKTNPALAALLPPSATACFPTAASNLPPGMVGLTDAVYCDLPKLGSISYLFAYLFKSTNDYNTSLIAYNQFKGLVPPTPGAQCPISNNGDIGVDRWSNRTFPNRSGQVLECRMEQPSTGGIDVPDYVWLVPTKHVILEAFGNPGSSMRHLDAWWLANADTGVLLRGH